MMLATGLVSAADRWAAAWVSVQPGDYDPSSGHGPDFGKAAPAGLLIWLFMGTALFFLIKSMNRHIKRVPKSFADDASDESVAESADSSVVDSGEPAANVDPEKDTGMTLSSASADSAHQKPE